MAASHKLDHVSLLQNPCAKGTFVHSVQFNVGPSFAYKQGFRSIYQMSQKRQVRMAGYNTVPRINHEAELLIVAVRRDEGGF